MPLAKQLHPPATLSTVVDILRGGGEGESGDSEPLPDGVIKLDSTRL